MRAFVVVIIALFAIFSPAAAARINARDPSAKVKVDGKWFVDGQGRVRLFHGVNQVQKSFPWYPSDLLNATIVANYRDWGFNVVRLGMMWSGLETASYQYNDTYLRVMTGIVNSLSSGGMYVIFDMHQDALSSAFGTYDGMPLWLLKQLPTSRHGFPWPFKQLSSWFESYFTKACSSAFQHLYTNSSDALGHLAGFWRKVADTYKDNPYVLGYELINEPWAGDIYENPLLLLPGVAGSKNLLPLYDALSEAIRQADDETIVFYEPVTWGVSFNNKIVGSGFGRVPGGDAYRDRSALAYHYYCWLLKQENGGAPDPPVTRALCDELLMPKVFGAVLQDVAATGGASFLTEFGICTPPDATSSNYSSPCEPVIGAAYKYLQSWTYWDSIFYDDKGRVMWNVVELFSRPYAQAIAGTPIAMDYNSTTGSFNLTYTCGAAPDVLTEIYASKLHYPSGYKVLTSPGLRWTTDGNTLYVGAAPGVGEPAQPCFVGLTKIRPVNRQDSRPLFKRPDSSTAARRRPVPPLGKGRPRTGPGAPIRGRAGGQT